MAAKTWTPADIRALAKQTIEGRKAVAHARGEYLRALVETAQTELGGAADQAAQRQAVRSAHRRFYEIVTESIATDEIIVASGVPRKRVALERNRRLNFARSAHGTIQRWLRASGHDLMKLDAGKVTKSQLLAEAPPTRKHAITPERTQARVGYFTDRLLDYTKMVAKAEPALAVSALKEAIERLRKQLEAAKEKV